MSSITLPNIRVSSDLTVSLKLKDGGVAIDWSTLTNIKVSIYSDAQRALAGRCSVSIDEDDNTTLVCTYAANKPQYVGINRVVVTANYLGETKTFDKQAFNFVRWTDDQEGETITIDDPDVDVEIEVEDVSSSILQEAIDAALTAAERAEEAASLVPLQVLQDCVDATEDAEDATLAANNAAAAANAAGITSASASVDNNVGTPAVSVDLTNKHLTLGFTNLKGQTGATGATGATPNLSIGTVTTGAAGSQAAATITGTAEAPVLNLTIPQGVRGAQGNTGSSVDYAYELVNNLTTDDATKGLSAAMGVQLESEVSQLGQEVNGDTTFTRGQISSTTGNVDNTSTTRAYSPFLDNPGKVYFPTSVKVSPRYYDAQKVYQGYDEWITTGVATFDQTYPFVRIVVAYSDNATISDASAFDSIIQLSCISTRVDENESRLSDLEKVRQNTDFVIGQIDNTGAERNDNTRCRSVFFKTSDISTVSCSEGYKYSYRWYDAQKNYITTTLSWRTTATTVSDVAPLNAVYFRLVAANTSDSTISSASAMDSVVFVYSPISSEILKLQTEAEENADAIQTIQRERAFSSNSSVGNCAIISAKQHTFNDGTAPLLEWYLLADTDNKLYMSRDLSEKSYLATFTGTGGVSSYSWGILPTGDIIACKMASELSSGGSDSNRVNPYVFKASEKWAIQHEVAFGASLKPCGWLESCGFTTLPDGNSMFAEYTRITVATCNCWKIVGDPLTVSNWVVKKSFDLSGQADAGFKHAHMVAVDFYTGNIYLATGDDNVGAMVFASTDGGDTWTQLREGSELYCRMLMMTFTEDYIYWAQDTPGQHYLFRAARDENGVLDYDTATQYVTIPAADGYFASYGQAYLPEYNAVLLLDRQDSGDAGQIMPIRVITLSDGLIHAVGSLIATDAGNVGFRTMFSEWYPVGGLVRVGFGFQSPVYNKNKVCGNKWPINGGQDSVNNLWLKVGKDGSDWSVKIGTYYL